MPTPATPTALSATSQWIPWRVNGAISNLGAGDFSFTSAESGQHRAQAVVAGSVVAEVVTGDAVRTFRLVGLPLNTAPTVQVRSENGGLSGWKTLALTVPPIAANAGAISVPSALTVDVSNPTRVIFNWTDNANNEAGYRFIIRGPNGFQVTYDVDAPATSYSIPLRPTFSPASPMLVFGTNYVVQIAALGGKYKTRDFVPLVTALSAEVEFTSAAVQIALINLPAHANAWNGLAFSFQPTTTQVATGFVLDSGSFPAGLAINAGTGLVSGTPADTAGTFRAQIKATNVGGHDTQQLEIQLATPSFQIRLANGSSQLALAATVNVAFTQGLLAVPFGPIAAANAWTLDEAPDWLGIDAGTGELSGTPNASGTFVFAVTAGNGTQSSSAQFVIVVAGVHFLTADNLTVYVNESFVFQVSVKPPGCTFTSGDLPAGVQITPAVDGVADSHVFLSGAVATAGDYQIDLGASILTDGATQSFTLHVLSEVTIEAEWQMVVGQPQRETVRWNGRGLVDAWFISSGPPGLTIGFANEFTAPCTLSRNGVVTGAPTAPGIYDAVITAQVGRTNLTKELHRFPVRIIVSGGLFLGWYHESAARRELQVLLRSSTVDGYYFEAGAGLVIPRGDPITLDVILRDAPIHGTELGLRTVETGLTTLQLTVRPLDDYDAEPWIDVGGAVAMATIGDHTIYQLAFTPAGAEIERRFAAINANQGAEPTAAQISGIGEVTGTLDGQVFTSKPFRVTIRQDIDR